MEKQANEILQILAIRAEQYIEAIREKYGDCMPEDKKAFLDSITDYKKIIKIHDYGSINGYSDGYSVNLPLSAKEVLKKFRYFPGYGINKNHRTYNRDNLIINDNTFFNYLVHVFVTGTDAENYYEDILLHETMHLCGGDGASALKEGINELLTRKVAFDYNLRTSACGYPKEVKIAYELQKVFSEKVINTIAFMNNSREEYLYIENKLGKDAADLYVKVSDMMEEEFQNKYYKHMDSYDGIKGIIRKINNYKKINYDKIYEIINSYKNKIKR